nr:MAG TPA: hypothetical protein [Caudoviricetes sp.]
MMQTHLLSSWVQNYIIFHIKQTKRNRESIRKIDRLNRRIKILKTRIKRSC